MTPAYKGPGIAGLTDMLPGSDWTGTKPVPTITPVGGGGGGGGSAQDGLGQIDTGAGTVRGALSTAAGALGGAGGLPPGAMYKNGGKVVTTRMKPSMKRNNKCSSW